MRMRSIAGILAVALVATVFTLRAEEEKKDPAKALPKTITPVIKNEGFKKRHDGFVEIAKKGDADLLFMGDSITDGWRGGGKKVWDATFAPLKAINFGIGGDQTQHVLWRIENGELEVIKPKLMVLMIGTNNGGDSKEDVALGITTIVKETQKRLPDTKILLLAIFPRGEKAENNKARAKNMEVNQIIQKQYEGDKMVKYMDIGDKFLDEKKDLPKDIMPDFLHPNAKGYQIWADAILPTVKDMMGAK